MRPQASSSPAPDGDGGRRAVAGTTLMRATSLALRCNDLEEAGLIIYQACRDFVGATAGYVSLLDDEQYESALVVDAHGMTPEVSGPLLMPLGPVVKHALTRMQATAENHYAPLCDAEYLPAEHMVLANVLAAPLVLDGAVVGVMALVNKPGGFDDTDLEFAGAFSEVMAVALASIRMRTDLEKAARMHRLLFEGARDAILWADAETGVLIDCNLAGERLLGRTRAEIVGMHQLEIHPPQEAADYRERFAEAVRVDVTVPTEGEVVRADGSAVAVEISTSVVDVAGSHIIQGIFRDIRQRKAAQHEIERHRRRLGELTAELARSTEMERHRVAVELHDGLGQGLAAMKMLVQGLADECPGGEREKVKRLVQLADLCISSVRGLTDELSPTVLYELGLASALSWLAESYLERFGLRCQLQVDPALAGLKGDRSTLAFRIVRELLLNVHRHAGVHDAVVRAILLDDTIVLTVDDEGRGFDSLAAMPGGRSRGFGLLSIREEVQLAGGTMEIDSHPGRGTHIDVRVPLGSDSARRTPTADDAGCRE